MSDMPPGVDLVVLDEVDSTMAEAARRAPQAPRPVWLLGLRQTAGRGRRGRAWHDPAGNLAATLLTFPKGAPIEAAQLSFVAALALFDALAQVTGQPDKLSIKWPNDVLLSEGKVAGILLESIGTGQGLSHLAIGIGVNLAHAPEGVEGALDCPVSVAQVTGLTLAPQEFLPYLAQAFARWQAVMQAQGFLPIREAWLARAARLGQPLTARTLTETHEGTFETIDETGALVLLTATGRRTIPAADVYFREA